MRFLRSQQEVVTTLRDPAKHSGAERRRAYVFICVYVIIAVAVLLSWFHFIGAWVALMAVQLVELILAIVYALSINDYLEKNATAMECERMANPLVDAYLTIRIAQLLLFAWHWNYICFFIFLVALGIAVYGIRRGHVYVDATDLWRNAKASETNSWVVLVVEVLLVVVVLCAMVFSILMKYS